jgi:transposase-like protein
MREKPVAQIAEDLGISDSCLRNWMQHVRHLEDVPALLRHDEDPQRVPPRSPQGCSRTTVARLMAICGAVGIHYKRRGGCTDPATATSPMTW